MKRCRKGQAALEFLSTYGFAFFILIVTLGVISYTGIFNVSSLQSNKCSFPQGAECVDFILNTEDPASYDEFPVLADGSAPYLRVVLFNTYGVNISINNATLSVQKFSIDQSCSAEYPLWNKSENMTLWCNVPAGAFVPGERYNGYITLSFNQTNGVYPHSIKGAVSLVAQN